MKKPFTSRIWTCCSAIVLRAWNSPILTTWASLGARAFSLVLVLPLILRRFEPAETTVWYLFASLASFQMLADLGFTSNFSRLISYAMGGATDISKPREGVGTSAPSGPNWDLLARIYASLHWIYSLLAIILLIALGIGGTWALIRPAAALARPADAWISWGIFLVSTTISLRGNVYSAFLIGTNLVAVVRRWETFFSLCAILGSFIALLTGCGIVGLTLMTQTWVVLGVLRNRWLCRSAFNQRFKNVLHRPEKGIVKEAWSGSWRTAIATATSHGLFHLSAVVAAQEKSSAAASYLFGLTLIRNLNLVAQAPFYSKLPLFGQFYAKGQTGLLLTSVMRSMRLAYAAFVLPFAVVGILGPKLVSFIHSNTEFPAGRLWIALGLACLVERYGAMHLQLFSLTNRINSHIANGVSGILTVVLATVLVPRLGLLGMPLAMGIGYSVFYVWYCSRLSHAEYELPFPRFDLKAGAIAGFVGFGIVGWYIC